MRELIPSNNDIAAGVEKLEMVAGQVKNM